MSDEGLRKILPPVSPGVSCDRSLVWLAKSLLHERRGSVEALEMVRQFLQQGAAHALDLVCRRPRHAPARARLKTSSEMDAELAGRVYRNGLILIYVESRSALLPEATENDLFNWPPRQSVQDFRPLDHSQHLICLGLRKVADHSPVMDTLSDLFFLLSNV